MYWIKQNRLEALIFLILILFAAYLRFYRLEEYLTFLGDEGRDALMIKRMLVDHDFPLLGPPTSVGNIYLGPLYYYMMAIPMAIFWLNPVAAAGMVAAFGVFTVGLMYYLARTWFGFLPAVLTSFLYSISPVAITYSRSSWNPNPAPFFALLVILGFYRAHKTANFKWFILSGIALAFALQMHYLALILIPFALVLWFYQLRQKPENGRHFVLGTICALFVFLVLMSPLLIFDFKYNFMNYHALLALFTSKESSVSFNLLDSLGKMVPVFTDKLIGRYLGGGNAFLSWIIAGVILIIPLYQVKGHILNLKKELPYFILLLWILTALVGLSFYKGQVYDHYLGFVSPAPFLLLGGVVGFLRGKWQIIVFGLSLLLIVPVNLSLNPLLKNPGNQLQRTEKVSKFIIEEAKGETFNFALLSKNNYDAAYQFYLDQYGFKPKIVPVEVTEQLFVVCEDPICEPVGHSKYEIAGFGWTKIESKKDFEGVKIFKLIHNEDDPDRQF